MIWSWNVLWSTVFIVGVRPVAFAKAALMAVMPLTSLGSEWLLPILTVPVSGPRKVPVVGEAAAAVGVAPAGGGVTTGATVGRAVVGEGVADELQAARTVGRTVRPAAPIKPFLRTSRLET